MSKNNKTIGIVTTIAAIASIMAFASFFPATTKVYSQTNATGNATATAKPASSSMQSPAASAANMTGNVTIQKTGVSNTDPLPGHSAHQLVMALPPRSDGKIWVGTVTWTASKPVEVVVLHMYNSSVTADAAHGQPLIAPFGNGSVAISLVKTPPRVSIPRESGVTSSRRRSLTSPASTPACTAAPMATTSSGLTPL